jgi:hypothetical protein
MQPPNSDSESVCFQYSDAHYKVCSAIIGFTTSGAQYDVNGTDTIELRNCKNVSIE